MRDRDSYALPHSPCWVPRRSQLRPPQSSYDPMIITNQHKKTFVEQHPQQRNNKATTTNTKGGGKPPTPCKPPSRVPSLVPSNPPFDRCRRGDTASSVYSCNCSADQSHTTYSCSCCRSFCSETEDDNFTSISQRMVRTPSEVSERSVTSSKRSIHKKQLHLLEQTLNEEKDQRKKTENVLEDIRRRQMELLNKLTDQERDFLQKELNP
eukprot:PhF_6_TR25772/c0_g1_i2/m.36348